MNPDLKKLLDEIARIERIIWFALTAAIVLYGIVLFVAGQSPAPPNPEIPWLREAFAMAALAPALGAYGFQRFRFSDESVRAAARQSIDPRAMATDPQTGNVKPERLADIERLSETDRRLLRVAQLHLTTTIIVLALQEAVALLGFVLGFLRHDLAAYLPFAAVAMALDLFQYPGPTPLPENASRIAATVGSS